MVHPSIIEARLGELRFRVSRWFKAEIHELQHILMDDEKIIVLACGRYFGSFAMLVATDQRLLLIDKRVFFMNFEDTRYDMISEIDFNSQVYSASVTIHTLNKTHKFTSFKYKRQLRELTNYVQRRVVEFRNQQSAPMPVPGGPHGLELPQPVQRSRIISTVTHAQPAINYGYTPAVSDARVPAITEHSPQVAQLVGSAAMQASHGHHWPRRPFRPYTQGSLMTRRPVSSDRPYQY